MAVATDIRISEIKSEKKSLLAKIEGLKSDIDALQQQKPQINTNRRIVLKDARHPLMDRAVNVPLQFEIGGQTRGIVITGPNTGGKTVAIKTVMYKI